MAAGDTVVAVDGEPVEVTQDLLGVLDTKAPGDELSLADRAGRRVGGQGRDRDPGRQSRRSGPGLLRVAAPGPDRDPHDEFGFDVEIDSGSVGGPSAGLAFTLAVLDKLTDGELTGGATVAVTGTIDPQGHVGPVGGVAQKAVAVRKAGADGLHRAHQPGAGARSPRCAARPVTSVTVIPVDNVDEALNALATLGGQVDAVHEFAAGNASDGAS